MRRLLWPLVILLPACGQAVFSPACRTPEADELARPVAAVPDGRGRLLVVNADTDERYCGGFIAVRDASSGAATAEAVLVPVAQGFEANFPGGVTADEKLWLAGRRYGSLIGLDIATLEVVVDVPEVFADRLAAMGNDRLLAWTAKTGDPELIWFDTTGRELGRVVSTLAPLSATAWDPELKRLWLGFAGAGNVQFVDAEQPDVIHTRFPRGVGTDHTISGMVWHNGVVYASDSAAGIVLSWRSDDGEPLAAEPVGRSPGALAVDARGRLWALDSDGAVLRRDAVGWEVVTAVGRPTGLLFANQMTWVLDYASSKLIEAGS
ncbi:MAG: hypothetical protein D6761_01995 [Candidatus Dadabacteria bacterium]|nr:MAG: hypothetical protein D6761_01995 [Candidatus Dadabacteria bacterium]